MGHQNQSGHFGREKSPYPAGIRTPDRPACSLVAIPTMLIWCQYNIFIVNALLSWHERHQCKLYFTSRNNYDPVKFYLDFHY